MENMAPTPAEAPAMVEAMLTSFLTQQTVNSFALPPRAGIQRFWQLAGPERAARSRRAQAFRLLAIVNRIDLNDATDTSATTAGEGRFVFGFAPFGQMLQATLIIEYSIPATSKAEIIELGNAWHALRALSLPVRAVQRGPAGGHGALHGAQRGARDARTAAPSGRSARTTSSRSPRSRGSSVSSISTPRAACSCRRRSR